MNMNNEPAEIKELFEKLICGDLHRFPKTGRVNVTNNHGVYIIYSPHGKVLHVGNTPSGKNGLNQRLYNHITRTGIFFKKYLEPRKIDMRGSYKFKYIEVKSNRKRALLEAYTAGMLCPVHFGTGEKKS